ncbi:hypothetical protein SAMN04488096_109130 [Mesonia phycicola]|uniref:Uncharacterized protein n=1 Tax=Mesonia phycicola TaxID=579105 RepID=A0A1M6H551_9FLAO|nr:hypothetical protein [Mesonia phycicola]SHJ17308.1 hypothetical protein SAMN04488096_109130 [Mesonia phycicola]
MLKYFLLLFVTISYSQVKKYSFYDDEGLINDKSLSVQIFKYQTSSSYLSDKEGEVNIEKSIIREADSIFLNFSFYRIELKPLDFSNSKIFVDKYLGLDEVVINANKPIIFLGPKNSIFSNPFYLDIPILLSINTVDLNKKKIKGIRVMFKKKVVGFEDVKLKNKDIDVYLYGFNKLPENYKIEGIDLLLQKSVKVPPKIRKWVEFSFNSEDINYHKYKYLAFGIHSKNGYISLKGGNCSSDLKLYRFNYDEKNNYWYNLAKDNIPVMQLILQ